jgi:hypothetical protein
MENVKKTIEQITSEELNKYTEGMIGEGIEVDHIHRTVKMTDKHENLVDTSITKNPTVLTDFIPNIVIWSIFQRKAGDIYDGNPLLYALKGERDYKLLNRQKVLSRIEFIIGKFFETNNGVDVTIAVPSTNELNKIFANMVANRCENPLLIDNLFVKMSIEEVDDCVRENNSLFRRHYGRFFEQNYKEFLRDLGKMANGIFQFHKIKDIEMRKVIEHTIKLSDEFYGKYVEAINGKNILIVDDSLTLGQTIIEACKVISTSYTPKSITVLTLFSPLYDEKGEKLERQ